MERAIKCLKFQSRRLLISTAVLTAIYIAIYIFTIVLITVIDSFGETGTTNMSFFCVAFIFAFISISVTYKDTFNNLLMFGNTRQTILNSFYLCAVAFSATLAILSELGELLDAGMSHVFKPIAASVLVQIYADLNAPQTLLWLFTLFLMLVMFALVYGALRYKFGKIFKIIFWVGFGLLFMLLPVASSSSGYSIGKALKAFFGYGLSGGVYWCSLHFFIVAAVLGVILWLIARRQPQNA